MERFFADGEVFAGDHLQIGRWDGSHVGRRKEDFAYLPVHAFHFAGGLRGVRRQERSIGQESCCCCRRYADGGAAGRDRTVPRAVRSVRAIVIIGRGADVGHDLSGCWWMSMSARARPGAADRDRTIRPMSLCASGFR
jgi:hypothetical protein